MSDVGAASTGATTDAAEQPAALPGDGLREGIVDTVRRALGADLIDTHLVPNDDLWLRVAPSAWRRVGEVLHANGFDYFCFLSALDWMPSPYGRGEDDPTQPPPERDTAIVQGYAGGETRFQVFARVTDIRRHVGVTIKADVAEDTMTVESWVPVYAGANWHERETHEMFGIVFAGQPDPRNMYLPTDFEGYPFRKDFPLLARMVKPWPGIVDVEPMPVSDAAEEAAEGSASDTATGEVAVDTATGEVAVDTATGEAAVDTATGEVAVDTATGEVAVETADAARGGSGADPEPAIQRGAPDDAAQ